MIVNLLLTVLLSASMASPGTSQENLEWRSCEIGGISMSIAHADTDDHIKYHRLYVHVTNNTDSTVYFDPEMNISAVCIRKNGRKKSMNVWSVRDYKSKIDRSQMKDLILSGLVEGIFFPNSTLDPEVQEYIRQERIDSISAGQARDSEARMRGYLGRCSLAPGTSVSGFFHVRKMKGEGYMVIVRTGGKKAVFEWDALWRPAGTVPEE